MYSDDKKIRTTQKSILFLSILFIIFYRLISIGGGISGSIEGIFYQLASIFSWFPGEFSELTLTLKIWNIFLILVFMPLITYFMGGLLIVLPVFFLKFSIFGWQEEDDRLSDFFNSTHLSKYLPSFDSMPKILRKILGYLLIFFLGLFIVHLADTYRLNSDNFFEDFFGL